MTRGIWIIAICLFLSLFIHSNLNQTAIVPTEQTGVVTQPIVIGYSNWSGWWPWAIAESEGLFAKRGVNVEMKWYDDYTSSMEDLAAGFIDGNCQTLNDTIAFSSDAIKGESVVLVNDNSEGNDKIIAASGINSITQLKGKKVAVEAGVVDDFLLTLALRKQNLSRQDVDIIDVETGAAVEVFLAGQADAVGAFPPFWLTALKREGAKEIISSSSFPGAIPDLLVLTQEIVRESPESVQLIVEVWFDVLEFMALNPAEADRIMSRRAGVEEQEFDLFKAGVKMFSLEDNLRAFERQNDMSSLFYAAAKIENFLSDNLSESEINLDYDDILNPKFIRALN